MYIIFQHITVTFFYCLSDANLKIFFNLIVDFHPMNQITEPCVLTLKAFSLSLSVGWRDVNLEDCPRAEICLSSITSFHLLFSQTKFLVYFTYFFFILSQWIHCWYLISSCCCSYYVKCLSIHLVLTMRRLECNSGN